jgi:hypothetical protein
MVNSIANSYEVVIEMEAIDVELAVAITDGERDAERVQPMARKLRQ